jgi:folylpolyglutamate synthase/dihydropteroate synthase
MPADRVAEVLNAASAHARASDAIGAARRAAVARDVICITGSMALVGEARTRMGLGIPEDLW